MELFAEIDSVFARVIEKVKMLDPTCLTDNREVGRKQLPTTVIGLLVHIAEHTQRHVGQAILTTKVLSAIGTANSGSQLPGQ